MNGEQHIDVGAAWHELGERLRIYVARRVKPGDADDVVQSVMLKLLEHRHEIAAESIRAWLFTVTRNAVAEHYRKQRPAIDLDSFGDIPDLDASDSADRAMGRLSDCLDPMLRLIPEPDAELLRQIDLEGEAQTTLSAQLRIPLSTLKSRVQRARAKLRNAFDQCCSIALSRSGAPIDVEGIGECSPSCGTGDTRSSCS
jgi:RNA polymerase sigma-70 factor, ECF subfamily